MPSYLLLWTEVHEWGIVQEIWDPRGIYISIPAIKIKHIIFKNIEMGKKKKKSNTTICSECIMDF
jgi:hypothetical protein